MKLDFSNLPFRSRAFNEEPMKFVEPEPKSFLSAMIDLIMIETGKRKARENWQKAQLRNLLKHDHERSPFWRKRIATNKFSALTLSDLPILTRNDVIHQVESEGPLLGRGDGFGVKVHSTSGSSGTPVKFFISHMNSDYSQARSLAQYLMEGRDLSLNRVRVRPLDYKEAIDLRIEEKRGFYVELSDGWLGPLGSLFRSGISKTMSYLAPNRDLLFEELSKDRIGYLVAGPVFLEANFVGSDFDFLKTHETEMFIPLGEEAGTDLRGEFSARNITVRGNYSSEEVGLIGWECETYPSHYHVAHSNVIVEVDRRGGVTVGGKLLGRILLTHLHSYATPFIRYDVGDLGKLTDTCRCGHDGPTISNILGRAKDLIKHSDGRLGVFFIRAKELMKVAQFTEYRIRQTSLDTIVLDLAGCEKLTEDQHKSFVELIKNHADYDFTVDVRTVKEIDWGQSIKRLGFRNEVL
jgi:phenylacetate-CoA ligase